MNASCEHWTEAAPSPPAAPPSRWTRRAPGRGIIYVIIIYIYIYTYTIRTYMYTHISSYSVV